TGEIHGKLKTGEEFTTTGFVPLSDSDQALLDANGVNVKASTPQPGFLDSWLPLLLPVALIILFFVWMQRRAAGQMGNVMSIGRSRAKAYTTDKPSTTFADIAGYDGVKLEIQEVDDFLC